MKPFNSGISIAIIASTLLSCQAGTPGRNLYDLGYGDGAGVTIGMFRYADEGRGGYLAMNTTGLGEGKGTNYDGVLGPGGFPGDEKTGESESGIGMSGGLTFKPLEAVGTFVGLAFNVNTVYNNYFDSTHILDPSGNYNVTASDELDFGVEAGLHWLVSSNLALGLRVNSAAGGAVVSLAWTPSQ